MLENRGLPCYWHLQEGEAISDVRRLLNPTAWQEARLPHLHSPRSSHQWGCTGVPRRGTCAYIYHMHIYTSCIYADHTEQQRIYHSKRQNTPTASFFPLSVSSGRMSPTGKCDLAMWIPSATGLSCFRSCPDSQFPQLLALGHRRLSGCYPAAAAMDDSDMQKHTHAEGGSQLTSIFHSLSDLDPLFPSTASLVSPDTRVSFSSGRQGPAASSLSPGAVTETPCTEDRAVCLEKWLQVGFSQSPGWTTLVTQRAQLGRYTDQLTLVHCTPLSYCFSTHLSPKHLGPSFHHPSQNIPEIPAILKYLFPDPQWCSSHPWKWLLCQWGDGNSSFVLWWWSTPAQGLRLPRTSQRGELGFVSGMGTLGVHVSLCLRVCHGREQPTFSAQRPATWDEIRVPHANSESFSMCGD